MVVRVLTGGWPNGRIRTQTTFQLWLLDGQVEALETAWRSGWSRQVANKHTGWTFPNIIPGLSLLGQAH